MSPATRLHSTAARLAAVLVPRAYRDEVIDDIADARLTGWAEVRAVFTSAIDARRAARIQPADDAARGARGGGWRSDLGDAARRIRRRPAAALGVIGIMAIALGLNTAVFSLIRGALLRPLPFRDAATIAFVWDTSPSGQVGPMAAGRALDLWRRNPMIDRAALIGHLSMTLTGAGAAERWPAASVSSTFFDTLGTAPLIGGVFHSGQSDRDAVVISHRLWERQWRRDPSVVGRTVSLNGRPRTILGVMPADFYWPAITPSISAEGAPLLWTLADASEVPEAPAGFRADATDRRNDSIRMVARLAVPIDAAQAAADRVAADLAREFPATDTQVGVRLVPAGEQLFGAVERPMLFIWLASGVVVLAACVNVGNLLLVQLASRRREFAVRSALGATRGQLARQLMAEGVLLALAGGVLGVVLARASLGALVSLAPQSIGRLDTVRLDAVVLGAACASAVLAGLALGATAAIALWRDRTSTSLRATGAAGAGTARARDAMVAVEVALAVLLLVGAVLFGRSLLSLQRVDVGFDARDLLTFNIALPREAGRTDEQQAQYFEDLLARFEQVPGVSAVGAAVTLPIGGDDFGSRLYAVGQPLPDEAHDQRLGFQSVAPGWFRTLKIPLLEGRDFTRQDDLDHDRVVILNRALADALWPGQPAVGRQVVASRAADARPLTVVGVVGNVLHNGPAGPARREFYRPYRQSPFSFMAFAVRLSAEEATVLPGLRAAVTAFDPNQPLSGVSSMEAYLDRAYGRARFLAWLTGVFGFVALGLAVLGVYGVTSFNVAARIREFGVRAALGATPVQLLRHVVWRSLRPVVIGAAAGTTVAATVAGAVAALLFGVAALDPGAYGIAAIALLLAAGGGAAAPAARAMRLDPVRALRDDA